eukprot:776551-Alexandrium_andersonii.AAC.1
MCIRDSRCAAAAVEASQSRQSRPSGHRACRRAGTRSRAPWPRCSHCPPGDVAVVRWQPPL